MTIFWSAGALDSLLTQSPELPINKLRAKEGLGAHGSPTQKTHSAFPWPFHLKEVQPNSLGLVY
jgi:hypothetical protein